MAQGKLLGFRNFISKKGQNLTVANVEMPYSSVDRARDCHGSEVQAIFLPDDQIGTLTDKDLGKTVELSYTIRNNRAYLEKLTIVG